MQPPPSPSPAPAAVGPPTVVRLTVGGLEHEIEVAIVETSGPPRGTVVWCHGLGGSRQSGAGVAEHWAARGYAVVLPTFADSIELVARRHRELGLDPTAGGLGSWALDPRVREFMIGQMLEWPWRHDRLRVVQAVLDALPDLTPEALAHGTNVGVGGHSFGAYVSQLLAGAVIDCPLGPATSFRDERVAAVVVASGQGRRQAGLRDGSWDRVDVPLLNITGTLDRGATTDDASWKREPFDLSPPGAKYQVVLDGGDHGLGGVSGESALYPANAGHRRIVAEVSSVFWEAFVGRDPAARDWLDSTAPSVWLGTAAEYARR